MPLLSTCMSTSHTHVHIHTQYIKAYNSQTSCSGPILSTNIISEVLNNVLLESYTWVFKDSNNNRKSMLKLNCIQYQRMHGSAHHCPWSLLRVIVDTAPCL
jgi:hypothetical protein